MTNKRGTTQGSPSFRNTTNSNNSESVPNSVARRRSQMGSSFSSSRRSTLSNGASTREQEPSTSGAVSSVYGTRYSRRSLNQPQRVASVTRYNRLGRRHTTTASSAAAGTGVRESSDQTPGPRRSARISSRLIERRLSTTLPVPPPILANTISNPSAGEDLTSSGMSSVTSSPFSLPSRPVSGRVSTPSRPSSSSYNSDSMEEGWQWREFTNSPGPELRTETLLPPIPHNTTSTTTAPPTSTQPPPTSTPPPPTLPPPTPPNHNHQAAATADIPDTDIQSVEIVRVVPHRLIEIPESEPFEPRPPPRYRPSSGRSSLGSGVLRRARRLLRDSSSSTTPEPETSTSIANPPPESDGEVTPTQPRRQFREIRFSHSSASGSGAAPHTPQDEHPSTSSSSTDDALRGRLFERAEHEALNNMIMSSSVTANERMQRLRLLRLSRSQQDSEVTDRERTITGLFRRRETAGESSGEGSGTSGEGSSTSGLPRYRMFSVPAGIVMEDIRPETSLRMSLVQAQYLQEVLLRISSLLDNLHILSQMNERIEAPSTDDPRIRTILAFATLDPDNMTYEQLLMLDELLPKNQGATKELINSKTSLQQYKKCDNHENDSCIICISDFEENDGIRLLPCCHIYHIACVDNWLKRKKTCPMCRSPIDDKPTKMYLERLERHRDFKK